MRILKPLHLYIGIFIICSLAMMLSPGWTAEKARASLLPEGLEIDDQYQPGFGASVGKVTVVQGDVVVIHSGIHAGYRATTGAPLFKDDAIISLDKSRVQFELNDGSIMTLSSRTRLEINKSVYNPENKSRSSFLGMNFGKARFVVKKIVSFKRSEFKVKTQTAVCGVRGSDFVIVTGDDSTQVTALEHTRLEIVSLAALEAPPTILTDHQRTRIEEGAMPSEIESLSIDEVEQMIQEFMFSAQEKMSAPLESGDKSGTAAKDTSASASGAEPVKTDGGEDTSAASQEASGAVSSLATGDAGAADAAETAAKEAPDTGAANEVPVEPVVDQEKLMPVNPVEQVIIVPEDELMMPETVQEPEMMQNALEPEIIPEIEVNQLETAFEQVHENASEELHEEIVIPTYDRLPEPVSPPGR